jgi:predicted DNA-binding transcriptional regulator YafY
MHFRPTRWAASAPKCASSTAAPPLRLPKIPEAVLEAVTRRLLDGRKLDVAYGSREKGETVSCELNPLGLVLKGGIVYLVCTFWQYRDIWQVVLHRLHHAEVLDAPAMVSEGFDLDRYIQEGEFSYPVGEPIHLEAMFRHGAAFHLHDTPLNADQVIPERDDERVLVRATVENTAALRWWLLGFGELIEVLAPADLREEFGARAAAMATMYQQRPQSITKRQQSRRLR